MATWALPDVAAAQLAPADRATSLQSEYRRAHDAARKHDWVEARRILLTLWAEAKTYDVAASLSEAEYALGHAAASAKYMDYALRHVTPNESAATVANMKGALEKLRPKVGVIKLTVDDPAARLTLDGAALEYDPDVEVFVEPGTHVFEARAGDRTSSETIEVAAGTSRVVRLELPPRVTTIPATSTTSAMAPDLEARDATARPRTIALFVGGALAVAGFGTGVGFGVSSRASESDAKDYRARLGERACRGDDVSADCAGLQDAVNSQRQKTLIANIGYGVGAAGLVTVGVALLWPRSPRTMSARTSGLELHWSGGAVSLAGKF